MMIINYLSGIVSLPGSCERISSRYL